MAKYQKSSELRGKNWIKARDLTTGMKAKLISEVKPLQSRFRDQDGQLKVQNVGELFIDGLPTPEKPYTINLNATTLEGLIDAFGEDSKDWMKEVLTVQKEKTIIGGKRVEVIYLIPDGYQLHEDEEGYVHIIPIEMTKQEKTTKA
jgi:hypothetical protein